MEIDTPEEFLAAALLVMWLLLLLAIGAVLHFGGGA